MSQKVKTNSQTVQEEDNNRMPQQDYQQVRKEKRNNYRHYQTNAPKSANQEVHFDLLEHIGSIGSSSNGWLREVNLVSWNHAQPGIDIRHWSEDHNKMSRGINLSLTECENLRVLLAALDLTTYEQTQAQA